VIRDLVLSRLAELPGEVPLSVIAKTCEVLLDAETLASLEMLCNYMPELSSEGGKWKIGTMGRSSQLLIAIENYAMSSGRRIFRLSSALAAIPAHEHPTSDELKQALEMSHGRFEILPNAMIRRNS
jgi:hypothetical protein